MECPIILPSLLTGNIFYMMEFREIFLTLLRKFDERMQPCSFLRDLVESTHLFLRMLERFCKGRNNLIVQVSTTMVVNSGENSVGKLPVLLTIQEILQWGYLPAFCGLFQRGWVDTRIFISALKKFKTFFTVLNHGCILLIAFSVSFIGFTRCIMLSQMHSSMHMNGFANTMGVITILASLFWFDSPNILNKKWVKEKLCLFSFLNQNSAKQCAFLSV